ncbi:diaminohydroxyphosphoribosylaminopyrimidine deaminase [Mycolicibacter heraklionensis]|nr:diaminohydroxyphosphoribosylaminopyrimidine deaminase [Mycolicibacter heraklionensis]
MTTIDPGAPVLVTGGSGYIASWIVRYLLEDGHVVRATVRDPDKPQGLEHLHALAARHPGQLSLHRADLLDPGSFTEAMQGCQLVMHTASPFLLGTIRDADRQLIRPALEGTRNVLGTVDQTPSVARVVLTSSVAAIYGDNADMAGKTCFTEVDWNTTSTPEHQPYPYSKTVAERAAWQIQQAQQRWDLVTIHPSLVLGPSLTTASASGSMDTMRHFIDMSMALGAPALQMGCVDVRDVARAHITAGYIPAAHGRYVVNSEVVSMLDLSRMLRRHFGARLSFPTRELPKFMIKLVAPVAGLTRPFVERNVGWPLCLDNSRTRTELAIEFRPVADSVVEHFQQMIDDGVARR